MRVLVQWATSTPGNWAEVGPGQWSAIPWRPVPVSGDVIDDTPGWINALCVQGVVFHADHYHVEYLPDGGVRVTAWNDDPDDWAAGEYLARRVTIPPLAPDSYLKGAINTGQTQEIYAGADLLPNLPPTQNATLHPWADFVAPTTAVYHGIWTSDQLNLDLSGTLNNRGWREWGDHLDPSELDGSGNVLQQRELGRYLPNVGTRTYYHNNVEELNAIHSVNATYENALGTAPAGASSEQSPGIGGGGEFAFVATTPTNEPDSAAWPTGTYRCQLDVTSADANVSYGLLALTGDVIGGFHRVNAALGSDLETKEQAEAAFSGTGLKLATTGSVSWSSGTQSDRFEILVAAIRTSGHGNPRFTLELGESDDFADGPWAAAGATQQGAGAVTASATVTCAATLVSQGAAAVTASATVTAAATLTSQGAGSVTSTATAACAATVRSQGVGAISSSATVACAATLRSQATGTVGSSTVVTGAVTLRSQGAGAISTQATVTCNATISGATQQGTGAIAAAATLTCTATLTSRGVGSVSTTATVTCAATARHMGASDVSSVAAVSCAVTARKHAAGGATASAILACAATFTAQAGGAVLGSASLACSALAFRPGVGSVSCTATVVAAVTYQAQAAGDVLATATATCGTIVTVQGFGAVTSNAVVTCNATILGQVSGLPDIRIKSGIISGIKPRIGSIYD